MNGLFITRTAKELIWGYEVRRLKSDALISEVYSALPPSLPQDLLLQRLSALLPHGFIKTTQVDWKNKRTNMVLPARNCFWLRDEVLKCIFHALITLNCCIQVQLLHNMSGPDEAEAMLPTIYDTGLLNIRRIWQVVSDQVCVMH